MFLLLLSILGPLLYVVLYPWNGFILTAKQSLKMISTTVSGCTFCDISKHKKEQHLNETPKTITIKDIKPKAKHHFLVLSKVHISKATDLTAADIPLLEEMERAGRQLLRSQLKEEGEADTVEDMLRIGFHYPPLVSVNHLHLHIIYPVSSMGLISRKLTFRPGKVFKTVREVIDSLRSSAGLPDPHAGNPALQAPEKDQEGFSAHAIAN